MPAQHSANWNTEFKHLPLYLEWAPLGSLGERTRTDEVDEPDKEVKQDENTPSSEQSTSTVFVKNLNFSTTTGGLKAVFSSLLGFKKYCQWTMDLQCSPLMRKL